jgi:molybdopterin synthase catalytic subunit
MKSGPRIHISEFPINPIGCRAEFSVPKSCGGYVAFEGIVRANNHGKKVRFLDYECYEALAIKELRRIVEAAMSEFGLENAEVVHRVGRLGLGDIAVLIQVAAPHRNEGFAGCRAIIDNLKKTAPIWKCEYYEDGTEEWTRCSGHH